MSSGKLEFSANVRNNKINFTRLNSDILSPTFDLEITWDSSLKDFLQKKQKINEFYHKAFEIHLLLLRNENLTNKEKLDFCEIERNYIKSYLKEIMKKNYISIN
ncbi:MAG: hypothetical protein ACFFD1_15885 [Candidatus Thorarchaeota archaeon]